MEVLELLGWASAAAIGVVLGLLGAGGSILAVPVLHYLLGYPAEEATAYSLFVVGAAAGLGAWRSRAAIDVRVGLPFALPSIVAVYASRRWLLPSLPESVHAGGMEWERGQILLLLFAAVMLAAGVGMLRPKRAPRPQDARRHWAWSAVEGGVVGGLTGLVGAGGGFLVVPALVLLAGLDMQRAVATSLAIVAAKSLIGFTGDVAAGTPLDFSFLLTFAALVAAGLVAGMWLGRGIDGARLQRAFGALVLVSGVAMFLAEWNF
jgi:uncharacterized membrane protein YfcA